MFFVPFIEPYKICSQLHTHHMHALTHTSNKHTRMLKKLHNAFFLFLSLSFSLPQLLSLLRFNFFLSLSLSTHNYLHTLTFTQTHICFNTSVFIEHSFLCLIASTLFLSSSLITFSLSIFLPFSFSLRLPSSLTDFLSLQ